MSKHTQKIQTRDELVSLREKFRGAGASVGFTSGAFDLLHKGHVEYLQKAKELCDYLFVGVNSDDSVRRYKDERRPISPEESRLAVVAALECVDFAFLFDEENNNTNVEVLKPDLYIKAGDYGFSPEKGKLSSAPIVERYGGEVALVPLSPGYSTSVLVDTVLTRYPSPFADPAPVHEEPAPAVFLDRDGTINKDIGYLHEPEKLEFLPHALEGMKMLSGAGYRLIIVTNQPGIGLGYYTKEDFFQVSLAMLKACSEKGIKIHKMYFSPYSEAQGAECRKPKPGMIERGMREVAVVKEKSFMVGDRENDVLAGKSAGVKTIRIVSEGDQESAADYQAPDLLAAAKLILGESYVEAS